MKRLFPRSVRALLWTAFALLFCAVLGVSFSTWLGLQKVDARMQELHRQSLSQVAQAIDLSKRSSDLAVSAPYLLNQRSNFLIDQEGQKLISILGKVREDWPDTAPDENGKPLAVAPITDEMESGVRDLIAALKALDIVQSDVLRSIARLGELREQVIDTINSPEISDTSRLVWWTLQSMNTDALNAAYTDNLMGVGEEQRHYQRQRSQLRNDGLSQQQVRFLDNLEEIAFGTQGIFELRRKELSINLEALNALFRIRRDANRVNEVASNYAGRVEAFLAQERTEASSEIQFIRFSVAAVSVVSLVLALVAALFVSRYVAFNISRVSEAMVRLARGDRTSILPRKLERDDEIGDLFRSFRSFRANALRLDRSNKQLYQRNALFEKVFANIAYGIAITDVFGRISASNPAFERILSINPDQPIKKPLVNWFYDGKFKEAAATAGLQIELRGQVELTADDGQVVELHASQLPDDGRVWLIADVTESQKMSERLTQIDRIETLGKVAGDTAHDFANILSTIWTHIHLLRKGLTQSQIENVSAIENAIEFGSSLTDRLLAFARKQNLAPEAVELNSLLAGMIELVEIGLKPEVELNVQYSPDLLHVMADPGQLESTLFNLILNSNNAIKNRGAIQVQLSSGSNDQASVIISDNGIGMPPSVRMRAIEPFFSTRTAEGGTGLGLSIVYGFIKQSGGNMEIESEEGKGTKVSVTLPIAQHDCAPDVVEAVRTALVIDDDPIAREAAGTILRKMRYKTTLCATATEALPLIEDSAFGLILTDFDLGSDLNGYDILQLSAEKQPNAKRILMSGKSFLCEAYDGPNTFVNKPITSGKLRAALEQQQVS